MVAIPHLRIPLQVLPDGSLAMNEQATPDDLAQCVKVLMLTEIGDRIEVPKYGVVPMLFNTVSRHLLLEAISRWEPRATVDVEVIAGPTWDDLLTSVVENVRSRR